MAEMKRHVGQDHLGNKVIVIFRELPEDPEHCLVVQSNTLSEMYHDNMMNVLDSTEAQQTVNFYEVLNRRVFGDGEHMLNALHHKGLLLKMKVDQVTLLPMPNRQLPLREANNAIRGTPVSEAQTAPQQVNEEQKVVRAPEPDPVDTHTGTVVDTAPDLVEDTTPDRAPSAEDQKKAQAQSLLMQARLMEDDAKEKRQQAYQLDPSLKQGGRPSKKTKEKMAAAKSD